VGPGLVIGTSGFTLKRPIAYAGEDSLLNLDGDLTVRVFEAALEFLVERGVAREIETNLLGIQAGMRITPCRQSLPTWHP